MLVVALAVKLAVAQVAHVAQVALVARVPKKQNLRFVQLMAAEDAVVALAALAAELSAKLASAHLDSGITQTYSGLFQFWQRRNDTDSAGRGNSMKMLGLWLIPVENTKMVKKKV